MPKKIKNKGIVLASLALGALISLQLRIINLENNGLTTSERGEQLLRQLKSLKNEEETLNKEIDDIKNEVHKYKNLEGEDKGDIKKEIEKYEILSGYTDVSGEGIEITIKPLDASVENDISKQITYNYDLLLSMINKLNSVQARAISINGQRVLSDTYMDIKEDKLYMNDTEVKEPITIKAIGDPDTLSSALKIKYGIVWEIEHYYNSKVYIKEVQNLKINKGSDKTNL